MEESSLRLDFEGSHCDELFCVVAYELPSFLLKVCYKTSNKSNMDQVCKWIPIEQVWRTDSSFVTGISALPKVAPQGCGYD